MARNSQATGTVSVLLATLLLAMSAAVVLMSKPARVSGAAYGTNEIHVLLTTNGNVPSTCRPDSEPCPSSLAAASCSSSNTERTCVTQWRWQPGQVRVAYWDSNWAHTNQHTSHQYTMRSGYDAFGLSVRPAMSWANGCGNAYLGFNDASKPANYGVVQTRTSGGKITFTWTSLTNAAGCHYIGGTLYPVFHFQARVSGGTMDVSVGSSGTGVGDDSTPEAMWGIGTKVDAHTLVLSVRGSAAVLDVEMWWTMNINGDPSKEGPLAASDGKTRQTNFLSSEHGLGAFSPTCGKGTYGFERRCRDCPIGKYNPSSNKAGLRSCLPCPPGRYASTTGKKKCDACPAGYVYSGTGLSENCEQAKFRCPAGKFQSQTGKPNCELWSCGYNRNLCGECPDGYFRRFIDNADECIVCGGGNVPRCKTCTKTTGELPLKPGFCFIGNTCYDNGFPKIGTGLDNQCNTCQWTVNPAVWSPLPSSTVCNDKQASTHTDRCSVQGADATCIGIGYTCDLPQCQIPTGAYDSVAQKGVCKLNPADGGCIVGNQCGCFIGGTCYPPGAQHPTNQCYECNRAVSTSQWTARVVGYTCNDGNPRTQGDTCQCTLVGSGTCVTSNCKDGACSALSGSAEMRCRGDKYTCPSFACTKSLAYHGDGTCTETNYATVEDYQCRAANIYQCIPRSACVGLAACPGLVKDQAVITAPTSLTLSIPADALGITDTPSRLYWTNPSSVSLAMTSNPTVACGKLQWSYYIIPKSDTVTCGAAGIARPEAVTAKPVSRSPPDASDGRPGAAATVAATIGKCSPGACGFTTDLLQGKDRPYLLAVRLASDVQSTTQVAVVCLASEFYVDSTPPLLPQTANFARHVNPDPAYPDGIPRSNVLHHTQKIALEWDEFTDPESPWFGGADTNLMYRVLVGYTENKFVQLNRYSWGYRTITTPVYTGPWGFHTSATAGVRSFTSPVTPALTARAYVVTLEAANEAKLVRSYRVPGTVTIDTSAPVPPNYPDGPDIHDGPPRLGNIYDRRGQSDNCIQAHWAPVFTDTTGPSANRADNIAGYLVAITGSNILGGQFVDVTNDVTWATTNIHLLKQCFDAVDRLADDGATIVLTLRAYNFAGLFTEVQTNGVVYDKSPPVVVYVRGLWPNDVGADPPERRWQNRNDIFVAGWKIEDAQWPAADDLWISYTVTRSDYGSAYSVYGSSVSGYHTFTNPPGHGTTITATVVARNPAGLSSPVTSTLGITIDLTPPLSFKLIAQDPKRATDGVAVAPGTLVAISEQNVRFTQTTACVDEESGIDRIEWTIREQDTGSIVWTKDPSTPGGAPLSFDTGDLGSTLVNGKGYLVFGVCYAHSGSTVESSYPFLFDTTPPVSGSVVDSAVSGEHPLYKCDNDTVVMTWVGFHDDVVGIEKFTVSLSLCSSQVPLFEDTVLPNADQSSAHTHTRKLDVALTHGATYCSRVTAHSKAYPLTSAPAVSSGYMVDLTPPARGFFGVAFINASRTVELDWPSWSDLQSEVAGYRWFVGTAPGLSDIVGPVNEAANTIGTTASIPPTILAHKDVYVTLLIFNGAGCSTTQSYLDSRDRFFNTSGASVLDAWLGRPTAMSVDEARQSLFWRGTTRGGGEAATVRSWWLGFDDVTGVESYQVAYGEMMNGETLTQSMQAFSEVAGRATFTQMPDSVANSLVNGGTYVTTVRARNTGDFEGNVASAGFVVDLDAPFTTEVLTSGCQVSLPATWDAGLPGGVVCESMEQARAQWEEWLDPEAGMHQYSWGVGGSPYDDGLLAYRALGTVGLDTASNVTGALAHNATTLQAPADEWLQDANVTQGQRYYTTVVGVSGSGRVTARLSQPFWVDTTPPVVPGVRLSGTPGLVFPRPLGNRRVDPSATSLLPSFSGNDPLYGPAFANPRDDVHEPDVARAMDEPAEFMLTAGSLTCHWEVPYDPESGIAEVTVQLVRNALIDGLYDVVESAVVSVDPVATGSNASHTFATATTSATSGSFHCAVKVTATSRMVTYGRSQSIAMENSHPELGIVYDGLVYLQDGSVASGNATIAASWGQFEDIHSGIAEFQIGLSSASGEADVVPLRSVGMANTWRVPVEELTQPLEEGELYSFVLVAINNAGMETRAYSNGFNLRSSPPSLVASAAWVRLPVSLDATGAVGRRGSGAITCGCLTPSATFDTQHGVCVCPLGHTWDPWANTCSAASAGTPAYGTHVDVGLATDEQLKQATLRTVLSQGRGLDAFEVLNETDVEGCSGDAFASPLSLVHRAGTNASCACPPGAYRMSLQEDLCTPCPVGTYKAVVGDSPALCRPCWYTGAKAGVQLLWTPALLGRRRLMSGVALEGIEWHIGVGDLGAQYAGDAITSGLGHVPTEVFAEVPFEQGSRAVGHVDAIGDNGVHTVPALGAATLPLDLTPPRTGWVTDSLIPGGASSTNDAKTLSCMWGNFLEDDDPTGMGIVKLEVTFGDQPFSTSLLEGWITVSPQLAAEGNYTWMPPFVPDGLYYASVRATNAGGLAAIGTSSGIRIDTMPPMVTNVMVTTKESQAVHSDRNVGEPLQSQSDTSTIRAAWNVEESFVEFDAEWVGGDVCLPDAVGNGTNAIRNYGTGIVSVEWAIGTAFDETAILPYTEVLSPFASSSKTPFGSTGNAARLTATATGLQLAPEDGYIVSVRATDGAGNVSPPSVVAVYVTTLPPEVEWVRLQTSESFDSEWLYFAGGQADLIASAHDGGASIGVGWSTATPISGLAWCEFSLGTTEYGQQISLAGSNNHLEEECSFSWRYLAVQGVAELEHGATFYAQYTVESGSGLRSIGRSQPIVIDRTPPVAPPDSPPMVVGAVLVDDATSDVAAVNKQAGRVPNDAGITPAAATGATMYINYDWVAGGSVLVTWPHWGEDVGRVLRYDLGLQMIDDSTGGWMVVETGQPCGGGAFLGDNWGLCPQSAAEPEGQQQGSVMSFSTFGFFPPGVRHRVVVQAYNNAGLHTRQASFDVIADQTGPVVSNLRVGNTADVSRPGAPHQRYVASLSSIYVAWEVEEEESVLQSLTWSLWTVFTDVVGGSPPIVRMVLPYRNASLHGNCADAQDLSLEPGQPLVVVLRATNVVGHLTQAQSPWFVPDATAPISGRMFVPTSSSPGGRNLAVALVEEPDTVNHTDANGTVVEVDDEPDPYGNPVRTTHGVEDHATCGCTADGAMYDDDEGMCLCGPGLHWDEGFGNCVACPLGTFKTGNGNSLWQCEACQADTQSIGDPTSCSCLSSKASDMDQGLLQDLGFPHYKWTAEYGCACGAGFGAGGDSNHRCDPCPVGYAKPWDGPGDCEPCADSATPSSSLGLDNAFDTCTCPEPLQVYQFQAPSQAEADAAEALMANPFAHFTDTPLSGGHCVCGAGAFLNSLVNRCVLCPVGTYKPEVGDSQSLCRPCHGWADATADRTACICSAGFTFNATSGRCDSAQGGPCRVPEGVAEVCVSRYDELVAARQRAQQLAGADDLAAADSARFGELAIVESAVVTQTAVTCQPCEGTCDSIPYVGAGVPLPLRWTGFRDIESGVSMERPAYLALGTAAHGVQLQDFKPVYFGGGNETTGSQRWGEAEVTIAEGVPMQHNAPVFATLEFENQAGFRSTVTEWVAVIDATPPTACSLQVSGVHFRRLNSELLVYVGGVGSTDENGTTAFGADDHPISATLSGCVDPETHVSAIQWYIAVKSADGLNVTLDRSILLGADGGSTSNPFTTSLRGDSQPMPKQTLTLPAFGWPSTLLAAPDVPHFFVARVANSAGLITTVSSEGFVLDTTAPKAGVVLDGWAPGVDIDCASLELTADNSAQILSDAANSLATETGDSEGDDSTAGATATSTNTTLGANWTPFPEDVTGPVVYHWGLGSACGMDNIQPFRVVNPITTFVNGTTNATAAVVTDSHGNTTFVDIAEGSAGGVHLGQVVLSATASLSVVRNWAYTEEAKDPNFDAHVLLGPGTSSVFVVSTVRAYNQVGLYTEACSGGVRIIVADCANGGGPDNHAAARFMCAQQRDYMCVSLLSGDATA